MQTAININNKNFLTTIIQLQSARFIALMRKKIFLIDNAQWTINNEDLKIERVEN
jgi:hypothetical protein